MLQTTPLFSIVLTVLLLTQSVAAHPGRTASDGCHYCRTNCASWGQTAGTRHCHGGRPTSRTRTKPAQESHVAPRVTRVPDPTGTTAANTVEEVRLILRIQRLLTDRGYSPGALDGLFGPKTRQAIQAFEADQGLLVRGQPSQALAERLEAAP